MSSDLTQGQTSLRRGQTSVSPLANGSAGGGTAVPPRDFLLSPIPSLNGPVVGTVVGDLYHSDGDARPADFSLSISPISTSAAIGDVVGTIG